jgi:hypothetical protein
MASERKIRRYSTYFKGWATAFGNHDKHADVERDLLWLLGQDQIGLILTPTVRSFLPPFFLGEDVEHPSQVELRPGSLQIADIEVSFAAEFQRELDAVMGLLEGKSELYLLQTYHLVYPSGTRILTLTRQAPLPLIYREIESLRLSLI